VRGTRSTAKLGRIHDDELRRHGTGWAMFGKAIPVLGSRDLDRTAAMYTSIGFVERSRYPDYLIVERDDVELHFSLQPDLDPGTTAGVAYVRVFDVETFHAEVLAAGIEVLTDDVLRERWDAGGPLERVTALEAKPWGLREFALLDVDNNLLRIGQPIDGT
jgi:hypothetical protein